LRKIKVNKKVIEEIRKTRYGLSAKHHHDTEELLEHYNASWISHCHFINQVLYFMVNPWTAWAFGSGLPLPK
jgi:hypothetical protein